MEDSPTTWDDNDVSEAMIEGLRQYVPSEEELRAIEEERESYVTTTDKLAEQASKYAEEFVRREVVYTLNAGRQEYNPLESEETIRIDNPSFVYWVFKENHIQLDENNFTHNVRTIKNSPNLTTVYNVGSGVNINSLEKGDLLFFNKDRHIGIYTGDGMFVSMNGPISSSSIGGVERNSLSDGYWSNVFTGHVERFTG